MAEAAADHWQRASAALKRNDLDSAEHHLVKLMALDPGHAEALQALRRIDLQRQRRPNPSTPPSPATMPPSAPRGGP
jgi:predicted Zn-dependent protease